MSRRNCGVFRSLVGGHSDRPAPEALRANAPISVSATAPPMAPKVRGLRFPRCHWSLPYRCARRSASFAAHCARQSPLRAIGSAARNDSCIARSASCTGPGWEGLLIGRGISGSGIPENGLLIFLRPRKRFWCQLAGGERKPSKDREIGARQYWSCESCTQSIYPQSHGVSRQKLHLPNEIARWGETRGLSGNVQGGSGALTEGKESWLQRHCGLAGRRQPNCGRRLMITFVVFRKELTICGLGCTNPREIGLRCRLILVRQHEPA
jgi:hypothetical protein